MSKVYVFRGSKELSKYPVLDQLALSVPGRRTGPVNLDLTVGGFFHSLSELEVDSIGRELSEAEEDSDLSIDETPPISESDSGFDDNMSSRDWIVVTEKRPLLVLKKLPQ